MPNICSFHHYPHHHMSFHMHKTTSTLPEHAGILHGWAVWSPLQYLPKVNNKIKKIMIIFGSGHE